MNKNKKYKLVSLFSGIGGLDLGFDYSGFDIVWANDMDKYAVQSYIANVGKNIVQGDIRLVKNTIPEHDVLVGGFPCQPFSSLGKLEGFDDSQGRGTLFFEIMDIIKTHDTKVVVLENVKNILSHNKGETFRRIKDEFEDAGYRLFSEVLNSADFGVPQRRNRLFMIAFNKKYYDIQTFDFPNPEKLKVTTQDLLDKNVEAKYFLTKKVAETVLSRGKNNAVSEPTIDLPISKTLTATMHKWHRASQDNYFTDKKNYDKYCDDNRIPIRRLTPNECRKLQGFPSDWKYVVSDLQCYRQFGNAVTVNVSYAVAKKIREVMDK
ncbi:MAG: DNA cytosine methyltransferase [Eubacterium sp.]|nr:DNA cytosine methyltransferase [Eubacterium sp.]